MNASPQDLVLAILRGDVDGWSPAQGSEEDWRASMQFASAHHVLPLFLERVLSRDFSLPEAVYSEAEAAMRQQRQDTFWWSSELSLLLREFRSAGVSVIPLKGPVLAERCYGAAHLRMSRDLDLLVQPMQLAAAQELLRTLGFAEAERPDEYHQTWERGSLPVELHHDVSAPLTFRFDLAGTWERVCEGVFRGAPVLEFAPEDELLYLCLHGARHRFDLLSLVLDVQYALLRCGSRLSEPLRQRAEKMGLTSVLLVGCGLARRLFPAGKEIPQPEWVAKAVEGCWRRLGDAAPKEASTPELYRFFVELEPDSWHRGLRRMRHGRIAMSRLIAEDYVFAARFGVSARWGVRALRPLRLLLRYGIES